MICAFCKSDIDNDSFYCDQCGKEQFICPVCGKSGKGKNCIEDGSKLFSPKQKSVIPASDEIKKQNSTPHIIQLKTPIDNIVNNNSPIVLEPILSNNLSIPVLKLINLAERIDIELENGEIIGNSQGQYANVFKKYPQVSGTHAKFIYDHIKGWMVIDIGSSGLGSTNGTAVSNVPIINHKDILKITPNIPVILRDNTFLLIANIEFQIKIISASSTTSTQRL